MTEIAEPLSHIDGLIPDQREATEMAVDAERASRLQALARFTGHAALRTAKVAAGLSFALAPIAGPAAVLEYGPPAHVAASGLALDVHTRFGHDTSRINLFGNLVSVGAPEHIRVLGKDIAVTANAGVNTTDGESASLDQIAEHMFEVEPEMKRVADAVKWHDIRWGGGTAGVILGLEGLMGAMRLSNRRDLRRRTTEQQAGIVDRESRWPATVRKVGAGAAAVGISAAGMPVLAGPNHHHTLQAADVFLNTPLSALDKLEVSGPFGNALIAMMKDMKEFYDKATTNEDSALANAFGETKLSSNKNVVSWLVLDDIQGVSGMEQVIGHAAKVLGPNFLLDTGDTSETGSSLETETVDTLRYYAGPDQTILAATGRHDSPDTRKLMQKSKFIVANDKPQEFEGMSYIGFNDAWRSPFGSVDYEDPKMPEEKVLSTVEDEAMATHPFFIFGHDSGHIGTPLAEALSARLVIDGRSYPEIGPHIFGSGTQQTIEFTSGSAGAHGYGDGLEVGRIHNPARFSLIRYYKDTDTFTYNVFTVLPDGSVTITPEISIDIPYDVYLKTGRTAPTDTAIHIPAQHAKAKSESLSASRQSRHR